MKVFPVVHINDVATAVIESDKAFKVGADGVYLIDHHNGNNNTKPLFETFNSVKRIDNERYVGLNILGLSPYIAVRALTRSLGKGGELLFSPDGLWADDMRDDFDPSSAIELKKSTLSINRLRLLGGIAFKYTKTYTEDQDAARCETLYLRNTVDVVTTSGAATGQPPTIEKIIAMRQALNPNQQLAVASGISAENINNYDGLVDEILVSTSVETVPYSGKFDYNKLAELVRIAHSLAK